MKVKKALRSSNISTANKAETSGSAVLQGDPENGFFNLTFGDNDMTLRADISPPSNPENVISKTHVKTLLEQHNVVYGVDWDAIHAAVDACNLGRKPVNNVLIARGKPAVNRVAEYFEINPALASAPKPAGNGTRVDYKSYSPFVIVKKDQILARRRPQIEGRDGRNVHGDIVPCRDVDPLGYFSGENTRTDDRYIYADIHGQLVENKHVLNVQDTLVIKGAIGYATGNIVFPGDVFINGPVSDGFRIYSGGSVTIKQTFDVTDAIIRKDLAVTGGIIGRGRALLKVGGTIKTRFIDNCRLASRNDVQVVKEIVSSSIYTMGKVDMADKGVILGSSIYALHGVRAKRIGTKSGKRSRIYCGVDFTVTQDKDRYTEKLKRIAATLNRLRYDYDNAPDNEDGKAKREKLKAGITLLEKEQSEVSARLSALMDQANSDENAVIEIYGEIVPYTFLEICHVSLAVTEPLSRVRIVLDRPQEKLVPQKLDK
jgi:uncharacterized protein (DUF342 family)